MGDMLVDSDFLIFCRRMLYNLELFICLVDSVSVRQLIEILVWKDMCRR